jgi:acetoin utilization protein AcuC
MTAAILYRDEIKEYHFGSGHPFQGDRYESFMRLLKERMPADHHYKILAAEPADNADLLKICDQDYIDFCREYYHSAASGWIGFYENFSRYQSQDNKPIGMPGQLEWAARLIIGQAKMACDLVQSGAYKKVVSVGGGMHHAKQRSGEGFCIYNDVAFSAFYLIEKYKLERVLVLDTDAHAGNGTAEYFRGNPHVLYIDIHQDPATIYPGTGFVQQVGVEAGRGLTVNIPLPVRAGNSSYLKAFDEVILPLAREFKPQLIIRNGGSDPHFNDGLTYLGLTIAGFKMMGAKVREMAEICGGKQIDLIASGYKPNVLPYAWLSLIAGVIDLPLDVEEIVEVPVQFEQDLALPETEKVLQEVRRYHSEFWKCLK